MLTSLLRSLYKFTYIAFVKYFKMLSGNVLCNIYFLFVFTIQTSASFLMLAFPDINNICFRTCTQALCVQV